MKLKKTIEGKNVKTTKISFADALKSIIAMPDKSRKTRKL